MQAHFSTKRRDMIIRLARYGTALACCCHAGVVTARQHRQRLLLAHIACAFDTDVRPGLVTTYASSTESQQLVQRICNSVALPANFKIRAVRDPNVNAYATVSKSLRYIVYDETFMRSIVYDETFMRSIVHPDGQDWPGLTLIAHEVGHHLCGHTLDNIGSRPPRELEADSFAGFVVGSLGGSVESAMALYKDAPAYASDSHPPRSERINAITAGWRRAHRLRESEREQLNLITHNGLPDGSYARVVSEFVNEGVLWTEYQYGRPFTTFKEMVRDNDAVYLYDQSRQVWLRITTHPGARVSEGSWRSGEPGQLPAVWLPLDPIRWR